MKILFFGDVIGRVGREGLATILPVLKNRHQPELIVVNAENAAHGKGLTPRIANEFWGLGVDVLTLGNHSFDKKEVLTIIQDPRILRPANYPSVVPGQGFGLYQSRSGIPVAVLQVMGRVYMPLTDCPFQTIDKILPDIQSKAKVIVVDLHAEITAEKSALGWYLNGRVSAAVGTHTHIQTADERLLPGGTAYQTDVGACGPYDSVIGADVKSSTARFLTGLHQTLLVGTGNALICGCVLDIDEGTGRARSIERIRELVPMPAVLPEDK